MRKYLFNLSCTGFMVIASFSLHAAVLSGAPQSASASTRSGETEVDQAMVESCPHAQRALKAQQRYADQHRAPPVNKVTRPALQRELLLRVERDQAARTFTMNGVVPQTDPRLVEMTHVDADNLHRLKQIIHQDLDTANRILHIYQVGGLGGASAFEASAQKLRHAFEAVN